MCTLIIGRDVVGPGTVVLGANRDENPHRPSDPPGVLREQPRVIGGRDRLAGGTWLAIREREAVVALLNRRDPEPPPVPGDRRSRGLLTLEAAAAAGPALSTAVLEHAQRSILEFSYSPFTLVFAGREDCWALVLDGDGPRRLEIGAGWHVLTHRELDDADEPRTRWLLAALSAFRPAGMEAAERRLVELLSEHGEAGTPAVCLHRGPMVTVSSTLVGLDRGGLRYRHAEGRPCEHEYMDRSALLGDPVKRPA